MSHAIKLGVIGAGSATFSAGLVKDVCLTPGLVGSHVVLMDIDEERVQAMLRFARRYASELSAPVTFEATTERAAALREADFVINTAQTGGHPGVERLRAWCEGRGYYRGFHTAYNALQIRMMVSVARDMERLCPEAWLIQASNPVFEGCTAMTRETGIKVCGLCHGHFGYHEIARQLGLDPERVTAQSVGLNHEIYLTHFACAGQDLYPLLDQWIATRAEEYWQSHQPQYWDNQMSRAAVELYQLAGLFPIGDTPRKGGWWFHTGLECKRKWYGTPLGGFDSELGWSVYLEHTEENVARIHRAIEDTATPLTQVFPARPTGEQHFPLIDALVNDNRVELQVNVPNRGAIENIADDVVVEVPAVCSRRGIQPLQIGKLPEVLMLTLLQPRLLLAERVIALALRPDSRVLLSLILDDHRTQSYEAAVAFAQDLMALPEFAEMAAERVGPFV